LFTSKARTRCKVLLYDGTGLCLYHKRLEQGRFACLWEQGDGTCVELTMSELALYLEGSRAVGRVIPRRFGTSSRRCSGICSLPMRRSTPTCRASPSSAPTRPSGRCSRRAAPNAGTHGRSPRRRPSSTASTPRARPRPPHGPSWATTPAYSRRPRRYSHSWASSSSSRRRPKKRTTGAPFVPAWPTIAADRSDDPRLAHHAGRPAAVGTRQVHRLHARALAGARPLP